MSDNGLRALCPECGYVKIDNSMLECWVPDTEWLLDRLRRALGIAGRQDSTEWTPGAIWKVGDWINGRSRRRIVFARRLGDPRIRTALLSLLSDHVERNQGVVITTTPAQRACCEHLSLPFVQLTELFRWRSGGLELDESLWAWCLKPAYLRNHDSSATFFEDYRTAIIDGVEYTFGSKQAKFWEYLHHAKGAKRHKNQIMKAVDSDQVNPLELFRHNPEQRTAYDVLVASDDEGFYWLTRP